jgi:hypothetical protein
VPENSVNKAQYFTVLKPGEGKPEFDYYENVTYKFLEGDYLTVYKDKKILKHYKNWFWAWST